MSEFNELFENEFFIIDSNDLNSVKTKLYGYLIDNGKLYTDKNMNSDVNLSAVGSYVYVEKEDNKINIYQDFNGCYELYIFKDDLNNFCISNSFIKLVDYVKYNYGISLNETYSKSLFLSKYSHFAYKQTPINEISSIPRNFYISIDIDSKNISHNKINYNEKSLSPSSPEALTALDTWYNRWTSLFRTLKKDTDNLIVDLSAGFDSRLSFLLVLCSNINMKEVYVRSVLDGLHTHSVDYDFAKKLGERYGFEVNNKSLMDTQPYYFKEIETPINISFYTKLGFHNQLFYRTSRNLNPVYSVTGYGGENHRHYHGVNSFESYITNIEKISPKFVEATKEILKYNSAELLKDFGKLYEDNIEYGIFKEVVLKNHFGKGTVEKYLTNLFSLNPLMDPDLSKIKRFDETCYDKNLLIAIIFTRYCPQLLEYIFNEDEEINEETIEYAKKINEKYPFERKELDIVSSNKTGKHENKVPKHQMTPKDVNNYVRTIFFSEQFLNSIKAQIPDEAYDKIVKTVKTRSWMPLQYAYPAFSLLKMINDVNINNNTFNWMNGFLSSMTDKKYNTGRLDIKGKNVILDIVDKNEKTISKKPSWYADDEDGYMLLNSGNSIDAKVKCTNNGKITFYLRGVDSRDENRERIPIYINYTKFVINGYEEISEDTLTWHDKAYICEKEVNDGDILELHVEWSEL